MRRRLWGYFEILLAEELTSLRDNLAASQLSRSSVCAEFFVQSQHTLHSAPVCAVLLPSLIILSLDAADWRSERSDSWWRQRCSAGVRCFARRLAACSVEWPFASYSCSRGPVGTERGSERIR